MTAAPRDVLGTEVVVDAPEIRPHRTLNAHGSPCETSWRLLGDVVNKVIADAERNYLKPKEP